MKLVKPSLTAAGAACASLLLSAESAFADAGERTPLQLSQGTSKVTSSGSGSIVRTIVGLAIVLAVIYGLYWVLKQVKSSREEKASGRGLAPLATLPLGPNRSLQLVRAGRDIVLVGISENGVTPIKTYDEKAAEQAGLVFPGEGFADATATETAANGNGGLVEYLRRMTVRR